MNTSACTFDFRLRAKSQKVQTLISKHLGILPKIRGRGNKARILIKPAFSAAIIVCLVYRTCL